MKFYNLVIKYRPHIAIALLILAIVTNVYAGFWPAFLLYLIAVILLFGYFFFWPPAADPGAYGSRRHGSRGKGAELGEVSQPSL